MLSNIKFLNRRLKMNGVLKFIKSEQGATAVEYGLMIALIAVVIIAAVSFIGTSTSQKYSMVGSTINAAS
jgi:pilus assembly protein Flp/PilA